jgi:ketosteroid isomerase-like protein
MTTSDTDVIHHIYKCVSTRDIDGFLSVIDPDIEWFTPATIPWNPPGADDAHGSYKNYHKVAGAGAYVSAMFLEYLDEDAHFVVEKAIEADGRIAAMGLLIGRDQRTGQNFAMRFCHWWRVVDGLATEIEIYADTALLTAALPAGGWQGARNR